MPEQVRFGLVSVSQGRTGQVRLVKPPTKVVPTTEVSSNEVIPRPPSYFFLHRTVFLNLFCFVAPFRGY